MNGKEINFKLNSIWFKLGVIAFMCIFLMIPMSKINQIIWERNALAESAKEEVTDKWSNGQVLGGVVLSVPAFEIIKSTDDKGVSKITKEAIKLHFLPNDLKIEGDVKVEERHRGIYTIPLYKTKIVMTGDFKDLNFKDQSQRGFPLEVDFKKAILSIGISEFRGLDKFEVKWGIEKLDRSLKTEVGPMSSGLFSNSINAEDVDVSEIQKNKKGQFYIQMELRGSEFLDFYPSGNTTSVSITSNWGSPSFQGAFLPESHKIMEDNFSASWKVLGFNREVPKSWEGNKPNIGNIDSIKFGVDLYSPLQNYQLTERAIKYVLLFIALTFITVFFIEIVNKIKIHPIQYTMIGFSLVLFYLLLLSLSEHLGFEVSYFIASVSTVFSITMYMLSLTKNRNWTSVVFIQLSFLYGFLYVLLNLESFALVIGAFGLWFILSVLMYATRKINWFEISQ